MNKKRVMVYQPKAENGMDTQGGGQDQMQQMIQQIQQMLQQADPQQVIASLLQQVQDPNMVVQLMSAATQTSPEQMTQAVQQVVEQMQQGASEGPVDTSGQSGVDGTQMPQAQFGGELDLFKNYESDFEKMRKAHLKEMKKGGETELDSTSTETYVDSLKNAILSHMHKGYAINTVKNTSFADVAKQMGIPMAENGIELPKAENGYEEMLKKYNMTDSHFKTLSPEIQNEIKISWSNDPESAQYKTNDTSTQDNTNKGTSTQGNNNNAPAYYYPGYGPGVPQYGWFDYAQQKAQLNPWAQLFGAVGPNYKGTTGAGFGDFENKSIDDFMKAIASTHEVTNIDPIYKQNIFGKEKRHTEKNIIGGRFTTQLRGTQNADGTPNANAPVGTPQYVAPTIFDEGATNRVDYTTIPPDRADENWARYQEEQRMKARNEHYAQAEASKTAGPLVGTQGYEGLGKEAGKTFDSTEGKWNDAIQMALTQFPDLLNKPESEWTDEEWNAVDANYKYKCGGTVHRQRMPKAENGYELSVNKGFGVNDWGQFASGFMGAENKLADFLGRVNSIQNPNDVLANRSIESIAPVAPPHSGVEGQWWENLMKQMAQDAGANVRSSSGTDWGGFNKSDRGFSGDFITQQQIYEGGGTVDRKEVVLNDDQLKRLQAAGYTLKKLY